ncbi:hypothetical protein GCM10022240_25850 [Microbacterium kribbense]|uniref:SGNH hydrolase-type esterase domain-containing protein n=1 Tax=Microbacterium kribbense TaxID=433645 RepID=A0ABP7GRN0_9MICO
MPLLSRRLCAALAVVAMIALSGCAATASAGEDLTAAGAHTRATVVTVGDSIMAGYHLEPAQAWPALLARQDGIGVANLACSGAGFTTPGDCGEDYPGLVAQAVAASPTLVIIQSSDNDMNAAKTDIDADTAHTVRTLHAALPEAVIVGLSTLWNQPTDPPATIASSSAALRQAVDAVGGTFVDVGQPLAGQPDLLQADQEHPTAAGQRALLTAITRALDEADVVL